MIKKVVVEELTGILREGLVNKTVLEELSRELSRLERKMAPNVEIKRLDIGILDVIPDVFVHDWAGSQGISVRLFSAGGVSVYENRGWSNGHISIPSATERFTIADHILNGDQPPQLILFVIINEWDDYNNPGDPYDRWTVYLRPSQDDILVSLKCRWCAKLDQIKAVRDGVQQEEFINIVE
jgi:hypothetical protein